MEMIEITKLPIKAKAIDVVLKHVGVIPMSQEKPCTVPSNSEVRRWLDQSSVIINGKKPKANDIVEFPITQLVFFPKSVNRRTTVI